MYYFFDPHPGGVHGCVKPLPDQTKKTIDNISGSKMTLAAALCLIQSSHPGTQTISHLNEDGQSGWVELRIGGIRNPLSHSWKVISYAKNNPVAI